MVASRIVTDQVWAQLDPHAGRLSGSERRAAILLVTGLVIAIALAIVGYLSGAAYPRIDGDMQSAHGTPAAHELDLRVRVTNAGWVDQHVSGLTLNNATASVVATRPTAFVLPPGHARTVFLRIDVHRCSANIQNALLPVAVVVDHWWGHESRILFSDNGNTGYIGVAGLACHSQ